MFDSDRTSWPDYVLKNRDKSIDISELPQWNAKTNQWQFPNQPDLSVKQKDEDLSLWKRLLKKLNLL